MKPRWEGIRGYLAWPITLALLGLFLAAGVQVDLQVDRSGRSEEALFMLLLVLGAIGGIWQLLHAPAMTRRLTWLGLGLPVVAALAVWPFVGYSDAIYVWGGLTLHLAWSLPWGTTMAHLLAVTGRRRVALWTLALLTPLVMGLYLATVPMQVEAWNDATKGEGTYQTALTGPWAVTQLAALAVLLATAVVSWRARRRHPLPVDERAAAAEQAADRLYGAAERAAAADPRAAVARDLLGWRPRFLLLPLVIVAALGAYLATTAALNKRLARADLATIMADYPQLPDPARGPNGPDMLRDHLAVIGSGRPYVLYYSASFWDDATYAEDGPLQKELAKTQSFYDALPEILACPDRTIARRYPYDRTVTRYTSLGGYPLAYRLHADAHRLDWEAFCRDLDLAFALEDLLEPDPYSYPFRPVHDTVQLRLMRDGWEMPPAVLDRLRATYLDRLTADRFDAEAWLASFETPLRFEDAWLAAPDVDLPVFSQDSRGSDLLPLPMDFYALRYRRTRRARAEGEQLATEYLARIWRQDRYLKPPMWRHTYDQTFEFLRDGEAHLWPTWRVYEGKESRDERFLVAYRQTIAMIDTIRFHREHGRWPTSMAELGAPELRVDPFSPALAPFEMRVDSLGRLRIWSIGRHRRDDGGGGEEAKDGEFGKWIMLCPPGWEPPPPPAPVEASLFNTQGRP